MEQAVFSLKNYKFDKVTLDFADVISSQLRLNIEPFGLFNPTNRIYTLTFVFKAFAASEDDGGLPIEKPLVSIRCVAEFEFKNVDVVDDIPPYFYSNSIAILFPYVRAFISTVTLQANISPIVLPTMNLSSLQEELKRNTKVQ